MVAALPPRRNSCVRWHRGWLSFRSGTATVSGIRTRPWCAVTANRVVTWFAPIWQGRFWSEWAVRGSRRRAGGSSNGVTGKVVDFGYRYGQGQGNHERYRIRRMAGSGDRAPVAGGARTGGARRPLGAGMLRRQPASGGYALDRARALSRRHTQRAARRWGSRWRDTPARCAGVVPRAARSSDGAIWAGDCRAGGRRGEHGADPGAARTGRVRSPPGRPRGAARVAAQDAAGNGPGRAGGADQARRSVAVAAGSRG